MRLSVELPVDQTSATFRVGTPVKNWEPIMVLKGPGWQIAERKAPFDVAGWSPGGNVPVTLESTLLTREQRLGLAADQLMTRLRLRLPKGVRFEWDWHVTLVDKEGKEYEPDIHGPTYSAADMGRRLDPDEFMECYYLAEPSKVEKIVFQARSHAGAYQWTEFKDVPLAANRTATPVVAKARITATGTLDATTGEPATKWICRAVVAESDITSVALGQPVQLMLDAFPRRPFRGRVTVISDKLVTRDNYTTADVTIGIDSPDEKFKVGMTANVEFLADGEVPRAKNQEPSEFPLRTNNACTTGSTWSRSNESPLLLASRENDIPAVGFSFLARALRAAVAFRPCSPERQRRSESLPR